MSKQLLSCPFCGFTPDIEDPDSVYPVVRDKSVWRAHCPSPAGGCSASILADSRGEAIEAWNRRSPVTASEKVGV